MEKIPHDQLARMKQLEDLNAKKPGKTTKKNSKKNYHKKNTSSK